VDFVKKRENRIVAKKVANIGQKGVQMTIEGTIEKVEIVIGGIVVEIKKNVAAKKTQQNRNPQKIL